MSNFVSYYNLLTDRLKFRQAGGAASSEFNIYDTPGLKYFKIFFYFDNGDESGSQSIDAGNGLLSPTWLLPEEYLNDNTYYMYNSAWSYLKMNDCDDRAELLENFVNLLSNISSESPWYFSEINGMEAAIERKQIGSENFTIEANRPKITVKCLPDSVDDRIGTLLDLYRTIVWDWKYKQEVLPANLRKFDMGILIYETPTYNVNMQFDQKDATGNHNVFFGNMGATTTNKASTKYFEFHNCEIDYNSSKTPYSSLNNKEGINVEYSIDIYFDDCYESRSNLFSLLEFGDFVLSNSEQVNNEYTYGKPIPGYKLKTNTPEDVTKLTITPDTLPGHPGSPDKSKGFLQKAVDQLLQTGKGMAEGLLKRAVLGNLYTFSLTRIGDQMASLANGDILSTARNAAEYIRDAKQRKANQLNNLNIFNNDKVLVTSNGPMGTIAGNTPNGPVSPITSVSLTPDNINSNFTLVDEIGDIKGKQGASHYTNVSQIGDIKGEPGTSHYTNVSQIGDIKGEPGTSHYTNVSQIGDIKGEPGASHYTNASQIGRILQDNTLDAQLVMKDQIGTVATKKRIVPKVKYIGNLYKGNTIADNL